MMENLNSKETSNYRIPPFSFRNGSLHCEDLEIASLFREGSEKRSSSIRIPGCHEIISIDEPSTPVYVYSLVGISENVRGYVEAMRLSGLSGKIGYAIKANPNLTLVRKMKEFGVEMIIAVSGYEVLAGLKAGFSPENILLNGNGKQLWEIKLAVELGVMMNVDSVFDAQRIMKVCGDVKNGKQVKVFLRIRRNPPTDPNVQLSVHEYVNTAEKSKFGFSMSELPQVLEILNGSSTNNHNLKIIGVHCHFGSGIKNPNVYQWLGSTITDIKKELEKNGVSIQVVNVGGGIGIDYFEKPPGFLESLEEITPSGLKTFPKVSQEGVPSISSFISALDKTIPKDVEVIIEPGRSLIGKAGILVSYVLGIKSSIGRNIMVVDGSMNEVIRPCLYGAHHEILPIRISPNDKWAAFDIVGPICESSDFLGKQVPMQSGAQYVAVMDAGAYCSSMASTYNLKPRAAEILVDGSNWAFIRERESFEEIVAIWNKNDHN